MTQGERDERIRTFIREQTGESQVEIADVRRLVGGSSRQVWSLDVKLGESGQQQTLPLVLRINPTPDRVSALAETAGGFDGEFRLLEAVKSTGAPVPGVYWNCTDRAVLGGPFYMMERIEGETIPRRIYRAPELEKARDGLAVELGCALAKIHAADVESPELSWLPAPLAGRTSPQDQVESVRRGLEIAQSPAPVLELAYRWLLEQAPEEAARTLVHGDFRVGNVIVGPEGLRCVLDWELAHIGDPHEDLAWMCTKTWRFGNNDQPVGGLGQREPFYSAYERESGRKLDPAALRYWELLCSAKVAVVWIFQLEAYLSGANPSVEHAAIGRRKAETEQDLLDLLESA
jgi:aminoglycoside phosphotransferase (APT) family kinase protein